MRKQVSAALVALFVLGMVSTVTAVTDFDQDSTTINVSVASEVTVDVHPQNLDYTTLSLGSQSTSSDRGFNTLTLENVGSEYVDDIWANATQTGDWPYDDGSASNYDAGNFLQIKPNNDSGKLLGDSNHYRYVNRKEYATTNDSKIPSYITAPDTGTYLKDTGSTGTAQRVHIGRFRIQDQELFFALPVGSSGRCDGGGNFNTLLLAKKAHNATSTVPVDFTDGNGFEDEEHISGRDYKWYNISATGDSDSTWGIVDKQIDATESGVTLTVKEGHGSSEINRSYDILTKCDTTGDGTDQDADTPEILRTRYNPEVANVDDLTNDANSLATNFFMNTTTTSDMLAPGELVKFDVAIEVPRGVPQGIVSQGTLRLVVSADKSQDTS